MASLQEQKDSSATASSNRGRIRPGKVYTGVLSLVVMVCKIQYLDTFFNYFVQSLKAILGHNTLKKHLDAVYITNIHGGDDG